MVLLLKKSWINYLYKNMKTILHWALLSGAVWLTTQFISGISISPIYVAFIVGACITLFDMFIKPIVNILTLPLNIITLGLFSLIINALVFWYLGLVIQGFHVDSFTVAFIGALFVSITNWILVKIFHLG